MLQTEYHQRIIDYYHSTENAYRDSWDLDNSLAIHYGFWDDKVHTFSESLIRMNEVMADAAGITAGQQVLDAGCGVGGSSIYLARHRGAFVTGITLSDRQVKSATAHALQAGVDQQVQFCVMDYCSTNFPGESFDVVWGCESICYAASKEAFVKEAYRLLRPGGRLVIADGFVSKLENNQHPVIRRWLAGWQVDNLETPARFQSFLKASGFSSVYHRDISHEVSHSCRRLHRFYYLANLYLLWKTISFSNRATTIQKMNIQACKYQYLGMKKKLWQYGLLTALKK